MHLPVFTCLFIYWYVFALHIFMWVYSVSLSTLYLFCSDKYLFFYQSLLYESTLYFELYQRREYAAYLIITVNYLLALDQNKTLQPLEIKNDNDENYINNNDDSSNKNIYKKTIRPIIIVMI